jgi:predicted  nucleic acid-binding Zn-ribbon protein
MPMTNQLKKKPENIFEAASELEKKRYDKEKKASNDFEKQNEELRALFNRCKDMHEDLSSRLDKAFERSGITERQ